MELLDVSGILLVIAAALAWVNHKLLRLPTTIGLMLLALLGAAGVMLLERFVLPGTGVDADLTGWARHLLNSVDFDRTLMDGMLGFLLFAGALHVDLADLRKQTLVVGLLATVGVAVTTALVGGAAFGVTQLLGIDVPLIYCLIFGALIAPTDPIAVLAIMKKVGAPKNLETKLAGESLFNDGVGVVVFLALLGVAGIGTHGQHGEEFKLYRAEAQLVPVDREVVDTSDAIEKIEKEVIETDTTTSLHIDPALIDDVVDRVLQVTQGEEIETETATVDPAEQHEGDHTTVVSESPVWADTAALFAVEVFGGIALGFGLGFAAFVLLWKIDDYQTEVLITLAAVTGGYALALALHVSGPLAMVVAGLLLGNSGRALAMSEETARHLDTFWELIDEILNAVLFVLIGLEVLVVSLRGDYLLAGACMIPLVLLARWVSVGGVVSVLRPGREFTPHAVKLLTWAGLRGGISVALALSLKDAAVAPGQTETTDLIVTMTYVVVVFSIVVQGLTVGPMLRGFRLSESS